VRICLDTNVLLSAHVGRGLSADLVRLILAEHTLVLGDVVLREFTRVLVDRFGVPPAEARRVERDLRQHEIVPRPHTPGPLRLRDPDDEWVLATAVTGQVDILVTGDSDLLVAAAEAPVRILSPRACWELLRGPDAPRST
jgi:putative PIN family toxin of toxin-antitoxin system